MNPAFDRFRELVLADPDLQRRLRAVGEREAFIALNVRLGREHGCEFSADTVRDALLVARRSWSAKRVAE